jgi:hypothetical protein
LSEDAENDQVKKLKDIGLFSIDDNVRMKTIEALGAYGAKAIDAIAEIINYSVSDEVKMHGLEVIKKIKEAK